MADIWQQFRQLPRAIRDAASTPEAMQTLERLEQTYPGVDLANFVMRVLVKEIPFDQFPSRLVLEGGVTTEQARSILDELSTTIFASIQAYLGPAQAPARPVLETGQAPVPPGIPAQPTPPVGEHAPAPTLAPEDDQEIASQVERLKSLTASVPAGVDTGAQQVMDQHRLAFSDELLTKRAFSIFRARLKGIRDDTVTLDILTRDPKIGGLGMDPDMAGNVVRSLAALATDLKSRGMVERVTPPPPPPPPVVPKVEAVRPAPKPPLTREFPPGQTATVAEPQPPTLPSPPVRRPPDIPSPPPVKPPAPPARPAAPLGDHIPAPMPSIAAQRGTERPSMADISKPTRAYGPGEEMRSLTVVEFRRLGTGATDSVQKLLEKFQHLQHESFRLWAEAIAGWRQSEIYQLYLEMGRQSLEQNISIKDIIQQRARQNLPYLSEHEFTTLADFNRQLKS